MTTEPRHPKPQEQDTDSRNETEADTSTDMHTETAPAEQTATETDTGNNVLDTLLEKTKQTENKIVENLLKKVGDKDE